MDEYFIGAGALLTAGPAASIRGATLHAQPERGLAPQVEAAVIDFESTKVGELSQILVVAGGWTSARFHDEVVRRLLEQRVCGLADIFGTLAEATGASRIHLFAHWLPDEATCSLLEARGVQVLSHPLEAIGRASLVSGQRIERWPLPVRAA